MPKPKLKPAAKSAAKPAEPQPGFRVGTFLEFCQTLRVNLSEAQRIFCSVAFDGQSPGTLPESDHELALKIWGSLWVLPPNHPARSAVVAICGARSGKTYLSSLRLLHLALKARLELLAPGEEAFCIFTAPDKDLAGQGLRYARGAVASIPELNERVIADSSEEFTLQLDHRAVTFYVAAASAGGKKQRGKSLPGALMDEGAFFLDADNVVNDEEIWKAARPRIMVGGQLLLTTTPWAESGTAYEKFTENFGHPVTCLAAHAPTSLMRDAPDEASQRVLAEVDAERANDPDNASREFDANFLKAGTENFFDSASIKQAFTAAPNTKKYGWKLSVGFDAGFINDSSAMAVVQVSPDGQTVELLDTLEITPGSEALKPSEVFAEVRAFCERWGCTMVVADGHYRESLREHLAPAGLILLPCPEGDIGKFNSYTKTKDLLRERRIRLGEYSPTLSKQLGAVRRRPTSGGRVQIFSPRKRGSHGDLASALVAAISRAPVTEVQAPPPPVDTREHWAEVERRIQSQLDAKIRKRRKPNQFAC